ncbi:hypothetical protein ACM55I_02690 [Flavobacterium sp. GB2R13]|uniref:hypothetical protein n=1 Tax=Flavobacterium algoris TaxID=3398733 RepID=UPI003A889F92
MSNQQETKDSILKLKRQAKEVRKLILSLDSLIDITELPIRLNVEILTDHKNLNYVWEEVGVIAMNKV